MASDTAIAACASASGDGPTCQTAALLGATDVQLESVTSEADLQSLMFNLSGEQALSQSEGEAGLAYTPDSATYLAEAFALPTLGVIPPDELAQSVEGTSTAQTVNATTSTVGSAVAAAPGSALSAVSSWLKNNALVIVILLIVAAVIATIVLNPAGVASAARVAVGG